MSKKRGILYLEVGLNSFKLLLTIMVKERESKNHMIEVNVAKFSRIG